jgi:hypothetical protein
VQENLTKKIVFCWHLDTDPLVRGMEPRIRIHTKMSWICNTGPQFIKVYSVRIWYLGTPQIRYVIVSPVVRIGTRIDFGRVDPNPVGQKCPIKMMDVLF